MKRANLQVITGAQVTRVLLEGRRAIGVEYLRGGQRHVLRARGEVILSGGAMNTPQLLQVSGIGPGALVAGDGHRRWFWIIRMWVRITRITTG